MSKDINGLFTIKDVFKNRLPLTPAGRLEFVIYITSPRPVLDDHGDQIYDDFGEPVFLEPLISLTPEDIIRILDVEQTTNK